MKINKKAQNVTRPYVVLLIMVVLSMFSFAFLSWGNDLAGDSENNINEKSRAYLYDRAGFEVDRVNNSDPFFSEGDNDGGSLKDFAIEFQFFREQSSSIRGMVQQLFNLPTFFIDWFDLDLGDFEFIRIILNTLIWTIIFYVIYRIIRGLL